MLLGGLFFCVQDLAMCEEAEQSTLQHIDDLLASTSTSSSAATTKQFTDNGGKIKLPGENGEPEGAATYKPPNQLKDCDTARGLFGQAASLVCNRLMASWKMDLNIALAAMEVLSGLAKVKLSWPNSLMCKRTVKWICDFIVYQCSRPAPAHSKDLHSMIVAAFNCLALWLVEHAFLLQDKECLHCVLEVVELGISGSKSQNRASDVPKLKGEKELKPASMRVKDAAEALLTTVMEHVGSFPPPCGPESLCSLLNEESLLKYCRDGHTPEQSSPFRYFVVDNTVIIGLLEQPLGNEQDPLPTVTSLVRGPFGRHAWTMQLRHLPRHHKVSSRAHLVDPGRPAPVEVGVHHNVKHRYFPPIVDTVLLVQADKSIPSMSDLISNKTTEIASLNSFIQHQVAFESAAKERVKKERKQKPYPDPDMECKQPSLCHEFQTARLFLSQFNFLSLEALKEPTNSSLPPSLVMLDTKEPGFHSDLEILDNTPSRTCDTAFIFYVKPGQKMPFEILHNVTSKSSVQPVFLEFLRSLGWPVDVHKHSGWTGHVSTSWKIQDDDKDDDAVAVQYSGGGAYDGRRQVLYWADVSSETAFVVPSPDTYRPRGRSGSLDLTHASPVDKDDSLSLDGKVVRSDASQQQSKPQSLSLNFDSKSNKSHAKQSDKDGSAGSVSTDSLSCQGTRKLGRPSVTSLGPDTKIFIVWLESYEDYVHFPENELISCANTGLDASSSNLNRPSHVNIIFIHALKSGLFRIHLQGHTGRINMAIPLVSGMVISRRTLGTLVRQTVINIAKRKRLENDSYQPPHIRRKLKIQEIVHKHRNKLIEPEFYTALFQDAARS